MSGMQFRESPLRGSTLHEYMLNLVVLCRWVILHGMPGFGKTVLAAEAVRDATILRDVFPGQGV